MRHPKRPISFPKYVAALVGQPDNWPLAVGALVLIILSNALSSALGEWQLWNFSGNLIIIIVAGVAILVLYLVMKGRNPPVDVGIEIEEKPPTGKAGLILLLSVLDARAGRLDKDERDKRIQEVESAVRRISDGDGSEATDAYFASLYGTNLEPALRAVEFHHGKGTLKQCWTIGTADEKSADDDPAHEGRGSASLSTVLGKWFEHLHPKNKVSFTAKDAVKARAYSELWQKVDDIFDKGPMRPDSVICDITGGLKLMSVGAALACLDEGRTMQYMATRRDWQGQPIQPGKMVPILVDISPYLE